MLDPIPAADNRPPRIIEEQAVPDRVIHTGSGPDCRLNFSFKVDDPDINDLLYIRWYAYMNFQPNLPFYREDSITPDGHEIRDTSAALRIDFSTSDNPLRQDGVYAVEGLVSDGILVNRRPQPRADGATTYAVSYAWVVVVETGGSCP